MKRELIAEIITSHPSFDCTNPPTHEAFIHFWFDHPEFQGYGRELLRLCGHTSGLLNFRVFIGSLLPEAASSWFLMEANGGVRQGIARTEMSAEEESLYTEALFDRDEQLDLETLIDARMATAWIESAFRSLSQRSRHCLRLHWGLDGQEPMTLEAIAEGYGIVRSRVQQIIQAAEEHLHRIFRGYATPKPQEPVPIEPEQYALLIAEHMWNLRRHKPRRLYRDWITDFVQTWMRRHRKALT